MNRLLTYRADATAHPSPLLNDDGRFLRFHAKHFVPPRVLISNMPTHALEHSSQGVLIISKLRPFAADAHTIAPCLHRQIRQRDDIRRRIAVFEPQSCEIRQFEDNCNLLKTIRDGREHECSVRFDIPNHKRKA